MKLIVFLTLLGVALAGKARFDNYRVYRITIENEEQLKLLREMEDTNSGYMFWETPTMVGGRADVVVPPHKFDDFENIVEKFNLKTLKTTDNLQTMIDNEGVANTYSRQNRFGWSAYYTLDQMYDWMDSFASEHSKVASTFSIGKSYEGRDIKALKISYKAGNPGIFVESNIHAREWVTSASSTWMINELITSPNAAIRDLAENIDWYFVPVANPDGFVYTHTSNRMWRKTRKPSSSLCNGADPNRNFGHLWMTGGASNQPCTDTYAGSKAFSEPETDALAKYYTTIAKNITAYIDFHSYSQLLMYPFGSTAGGRISNEQEHIDVGTQMAKKVSERYGTQYKFGNIVTTIYVASGGSIDWIKGVHDTPFVFVYEMRDTGRYGFILPAEQIVPNAQEVMDSLVEMVKQARLKGYFRQNK
jgi:carboxypeptidase A